MARRGVSAPAEASAFLEPDLDQLHDPHLLAGLSAAVERLVAAREAGESVALVGDYDVDGVSGTAILTAVLRACGLTVVPILPHPPARRLRLPAGPRRASGLAQSCRLIVTIDCGTSSGAAAEAALEAGLDVVVTDHHLPGEPLPDGVLMINPRQDDCAYPFDELSGAGIAFKLARAVADACGRRIEDRILLRIACLGTIADLVPLVGENRVIAAVGLNELRATRSAGLKALIRVSRLQPPYSATDVGYRLGPRLNAPGRIDTAESALELLLCRDAHRALELALELDRRNRERQDWERQVVEEARAQILDRHGDGGDAEDIDLPPILVAWSDSWHRGVVGIAAGRLAKEFHRPTLLLAVDGELATGSGRSLPGIHLYDFLAGWREQLPKFGGHAQAIGMSVEVEKLADLRQGWEEAGEAWRELISVRRFEYELDCEAADLTPEMVAELARFEPHGQANPRPLIRIRGPLRLVRPARRFGQGNLEAEASGQNGATMRFVGWGWQDREASLGGDFEALARLEYDRYRHRSVLRLVDSRPWVASG